MLKDKFLSWDGSDRTLFLPSENDGLRMAGNFQKMGEKKQYHRLKKKRRKDGHE